ncbi:hypothetical protein EXIGLDRAFT_726002 [Exidia glandulosa HHB12029]|uniref:Uncharacterized protein n=1 Tax=Exidia glandulosa HHB12029 TaxID=1314781 RepID=A0A165DWW9_EXIGL|nr:hypothetical protein EXIGLDRAFT_726002 [Exidia glandulosa HHB12029]
MPRRCRRPGGRVQNGNTRSRCTGTGRRHWTSRGTNFSRTDRQGFYRIQSSHGVRAADCPEILDRPRIAKVARQPAEV